MRKEEKLIENHIPFPVVEEIHAGNLKSEIMPRNLNEIVRS
jgi:hypothetical protein